MKYLNNSLQSRPDTYLIICFGTKPRTGLELDKTSVKYQIQTDFFSWALFGSDWARFQLSPQEAKGIQTGFFILFLLIKIGMRYQVSV